MAAQIWRYCILPLPVLGPIEFIMLAGTCKTLRRLIKDEGDHLFLPHFYRRFPVRFKRCEGLFRYYDFYMYYLRVWFSDVPKDELIQFMLEIPAIYQQAILKTMWMFRDRIVQRAKTITLLHWLGNSFGEQREVNGPIRRYPAQDPRHCLWLDHDTRKRQVNMLFSPTLAFWKHLFHPSVYAKQCPEKKQAWEEYHACDACGRETQPMIRVACRSPFCVCWGRIAEFCTHCFRKFECSRCKAVIHPSVSTKCMHICDAFPLSKKRKRSLGSN